MSIRAVCYARVSSSGQRERDTIASQLRILPEYVARQGWKLERPASTYIDDGMSARSGKLEARRGLAALLRDATLGLFDIVVVVDVDRLTRADDLIERWTILGTLQRAGVRVASTMGGDVLDLNTGHGDLIAAIKANLAAEENRKRAERVRAGKVTRARQGRKAGSRTPFGHTYDRVTGVWGIDPVKAPLVVEVITRVAAGASCQEIADDFDRRGVALKGNLRWTRHRMWELVKSTHCYGESHGCGVRFAIPPLVTRELWDRAQRALEVNRTAKRGKTWHVYLLDKVSTCAKCGGTMRVRSAVKTGKGFLVPAVYICVNRILRKRSETPCDAPYVQVVDADARAWNMLVRELEDPELLDAIALERSERAGEVHDWSADLEGFRKHLARLDGVETALLARFRRGAISENAMDAELRALKRERDAVDSQVKAANRAQNIATGSQERLEAGAALLGRLRERLAVSEPAARREVFRTLVNSVVFRDGKVILELLIPRPEAVSAPVVASVAASCSTERSYSGEIAVLRVRVAG